MLGLRDGNGSFFVTHDPCDSITQLTHDPRPLHGTVVLDNPLGLDSKNKKAQLTQGLRATAPSFQDGGCSKMAVSRHLGYY